MDVNTLNIMRKKNIGINVVIATAGKDSLLAKDINIFYTQYPKLLVKITINSHYRFLILDKSEVYYIGASIKDAGKKSFEITKIEDKDVVKSLVNRVR